MHARSAKQEALHAIERLPDDVPFDEIVYRRTVATEELAREIEAW
jgi:hypothetical protein